jgi:hypothetical protein
MVRWALGTLLAAILVLGGFSPLSANPFDDDGDAAVLVKGRKGKKKGGKKKGGKKKGRKKHAASPSA